VTCEEGKNQIRAIGGEGGERKLSSLSVLNDQWRKKRVGL
jgi:hypothetical protein